MFRCHPTDQLESLNGVYDLLADDEEVHNLKDHQKEEMEKLLAKHEAELKNLKEKRQKKKQAQLASINKRLQQQQQQGHLQQQRSDDDINDV